MKNNWLDNKTVVVTGASSGIGKELVKRLIFEHNCIVLGIARNQEKMRQLAQELGEKSFNFSYQLFDVGVESNWRDFVSFLNSSNISVDVLINNAGVLPKLTKFVNYSIQDITTVINTNLLSSLYATSIMYPIISKSQSPAIINIASSAVFLNIHGSSVYTATKQAVKSFTEILAMEMKKKMYVGLVMPGLTKTDIFRGQSTVVDSRVEKLATPVSKAVDTIMRCIRHKKKRIVVNWDAKLMRFGKILAPHLSTMLCNNILKSSNVDMFKDVY